MKIRNAVSSFVLAISVAAMMVLPSCTNPSSPEAIAPEKGAEQPAFVLPQENPASKPDDLKRHSVEMYELAAPIAERGELDAEKIFPKVMPAVLTEPAPFEGAPGPNKTQMLMLCAHLQKDDCAKHVLPALVKMAEHSDSLWGGFFKRDSYMKELRRNARVLGTMLEYVKSGAEGYEELGATSVHAIEYVVQFLEAEEGGFFFGQNEDMKIADSIMNGEEFYALGPEDRLEKGMPEIKRWIEPGDTALMSGVLFEAADIYNRPEWRKRAISAIERISPPDFEPGYCEVDEEVLEGICGYQESTPYAFLLQSYIDAYEGTGETAWLNRAVKLADYIISEWYESKYNDFGIMSFEGQGDFSMPGVNAQMVRNLDRLYPMTDNAVYQEIAGEVLQMMWSTYPEEDGWHGPSFELAAYYHFNHPIKIVVVGERSDPATESLRRQASVFYELNKVIMVLAPEEDAERLSELPYTVQPQPTLYACVETACSMPMDTPEAVTEMLPRFVDRYMYGQGGGIKKFKLD